MKSARRTILVSVDAEDEAQQIGPKGVDQPGASAGLVPRELDAEIIEDNVSEFLESIEGILKKAPNVIGGFQIKDFTVSAQITADGKVSLLGVGGGIAASGGLTFTFERIAEEAQG